MIRLCRLVRICSADQGIGKLLCGIRARRVFNSGLPSFDHRKRKEQNLWRQTRWFSAMTGAEPVSEGGIVEVPLAQTGEGIADCELLRWFVQEGEYVEEFQPLCEVQSDKAAIEITSRYRGKVTKVNFMPGAVVKVGETLLEVMLDGATSISSPSTSSSPETDKVLATPAVRGLAKQLGINLRTVHGSGEDGRVLKDDLLKLASVKGLEEEISGITPPSTTAGTDTTSQVSVQVVEVGGETSTCRVEEHERQSSTSHVSIKVEEDEVIPVRGFRRTMAKTMTAAAAIPHFHYMEDVCMDALVKLKADLQQRTGLKLTYLPFLIKALSLTLQKYPILNSNVSECATEIRCKKWHNIGVAMATKNGLAVPNIKQVQQLSVKEISEEVTRLSKLAGDNKLTWEDVNGGTITVSNFGAIGGKFGSPVLNLPEAAILGVGRIQKLPRFDVHGNVYPASIMSVTWGADHRVLDGATIANFCNEWKHTVEHPEEWLLHLR